MLTRRTLLALSGFALIAAGSGWLSEARAQSLSPATAQQFVQQTGDQLVSIVNGPGSTEQKKAELQAVINRSVDVTGVARFCLGSALRRATPQQLSEYIQLFHEVLMNNITGKLGEYRGVRFAVGRAEPRAVGVEVHTVVNRPENAPANVDWIVQDVGGSPKIVDVVAEGTSLRITQRSDYASYLARNGFSVQALIDAMKRQLQG